MSMSKREVGGSLEHSGPTSSTRLTAHGHWAVFSQAVVTYRREATADVGAAPGVIFAYLDDHTRLSAHMTRRSWMMAGSRMVMELDDSKGRAVGSRIRLSGRVFGMMLGVEEIVTERNPPNQKAWETTSEPRLLIIGRYRMGFEIEPRMDSSHLMIFIDYALPESFSARWLGRIFGRVYAQWCTRRMAHDAAMHFGTK